MGQGSVDCNVPNPYRQHYERFTYSEIRASQKHSECNREAFETVEFKRKTDILFEI
jgi:hypothetical protein